MEKDVMSVRKWTDMQGTVCCCCALAVSCCLIVVCSVWRKRSGVECGVPPASSVGTNVGFVCCFLLGEGEGCMGGAQSLSHFPHSYRTSTPYRQTHIYSTLRCLATLVTHTHTSSQHDSCTHSHSPLGSQAGRLGGLWWFC